MTTGSIRRRRMNDTQHKKFIVKRTMGSSSSRAQLEQPKSKTIETPSAYYGNNDDMGDLSERQLQDRIRELQLERLQRRMPRREPEPKKLKSFISVINPVILTSSGVTSLVLGLKNQAPVTVACTSNGLVTSFEYPTSPDQTTFGIPLPAPGSDFLLEITPDWRQSGVEVQPGYSVVRKHVFIFVFCQTEDSPRYEWREQHLVTSEQTWVVSVSRMLENRVETHQGKCLICMVGDAVEGSTQCEHRLICETCRGERKARLCKCPVCQAAPREM